ncbi:hypothetical protein EQV93_05325 [Pseudomonas sp. TMW22091]|nr:hypothetical protein [Pseudomonas sp. TMW22091]
MWKPINFTGHYLTPASIKLTGGLNNYQYLPNPTGWVETLGLNPTRPGGTLLEGGCCTHLSRPPSAQRECSSIVWSIPQSRCPTAHRGYPSA